MRLMNRLFTTFLLVSIMFTSKANLTGNGYYRVQNYGTSRWASLIDDKGQVDIIAGTADLHSLQLNKDTQEILSDPASIVFVYNLAGNQYDVAAQGTSLETLVDNPIYIDLGPSVNGQGLYYIWGTTKNVVKYIADGNTSTTAQYGSATINDVGTAKYRQWFFIPVSAETDNYFGAVPSITINGTGYCTLFTSFAYKPYSPGVKAYYINRVGFGMAEMIEITGGIPTGSPVVIQCAGSSVSDNKMEIINSQDALPSNALNGVYFDYVSNDISNRVAYDSNTMRVLGITSDGELGFVTANLDYIPANTAYLKVPYGSSREFKCVSSSQFETNIPKAPEQLFFGNGNALQPQDEYTYTGTYVFPENYNTSFRFYTSSNQTISEWLGADIYNGKDINITLNSPYAYPFSYGSPYSWVIPNWTGGDITITVNLQYQYVRFANKAGVDSIENDSFELRFDGKNVLGQPGTEIKIIDLSGRLIRTSLSGQINISELPKGIYIAVSGQKSIKILN